jgi:hypothetical protein
MTVKLCISILCCLTFMVDSCDSKSGVTQGSTSPNAPVNAPPTTAASSTSPANLAGATMPTDAKPEPAANGDKARTSALDACSLISKSEIESVQRGKLQGTVPSKRDGGALAISQCYYTVFSADGKQNLSVHLEVTQNESKVSGQDALGDFWRQFQVAKASKKAEKPMPVAGLGSGAYWVGNTKIGSLYALKGGKLLRLSLGGPDDGKKLEKSKTLAAKALTRLG